MNYQWYPGHMTKAKRMMQEDMKLIDLVIELLDARIPYSSRNPDIDTLAGGKSRIILLNKADLADPEGNRLWTAYFKEQGFFVQELNSKSGVGFKSVHALIQDACREKAERDRRRGILNRPVRAMVAGIPNVGKSTFINSFAGRSSAKTGNKPGVTRGKQWIKVSKNLELLDTPGILWPRFEDQSVGLRLALIGSINDEILQTEELSLEAIRFLQNAYPQELNTRYGISPELEAPDFLREVCEKRKCYRKGTEPDYHKAAGLLLDEFRNGQIGKMTLEFPKESA